MLSFPTIRYQFNPDLYNPDVVVNILIKALASVPFPDFNLSAALLDDRADSIREVALRAVRATFQKIGSKRLGSYLDFEGDLTTYSPEG